MYLKGTETEQGKWRERETFHLLADCSNACNSCGWISSESLMWVWARVWKHLSSPLLLPQPYQLGARLEEQANLEPVPIGCWHCSQWSALV